MNIGIILPHLSPSQIKDEVFDIVNQHGQNNNFSYSIFYENVSPNLRVCLAPIFNIADSKFFSGKLIGFSLESSTFLLKNFKNVKSCLYLYDIPWRNNNDFVQNNIILRNENLTLYSRSKDYCKLIKNYCGKEPKLSSIEDLLTCGE